jgi:CRP-like cAMP-binding protein
MAQESISPKDLSDFLLFSLLVPEECHIIAPLFREQSFATGETLIRQDDTSTHLFLITSGIIEVRLPLIAPLASTSVAKFGPKECVGELTLAKIARRAASAVAHVESRCWVVDTVKLIELFEQHPKIGYHVYRKLSEIITERLIATNMMLRNSESHL